MTWTLQGTVGAASYPGPLVTHVCWNFNHLENQSRRGDNTSFGYDLKSHCYSCRLSALVENSHHADIRSTAQKITLCQQDVRPSKKRDKRRLVVHIRSAIYHELSRTQPKLERICAVLASMRWLLCSENKRDLTSTKSPTNDNCDQAQITPQESFLHHGFNQSKTISLQENCR